MVDEIQLQNRVRIYTLTTECIIHLHDLLSKNYHLVDKMDPVEPPGIKNIHMLESAVFRQQTGSNGWYKYDTVFANCATLVFAIVNNHPFHNGNKRVAFLAMIKHLFENGYVIKPDTKHKDIYSILLSLADNSFEHHIATINKNIYRQLKSKEKWTDEKVIIGLASWIRKACESKDVFIKNMVRLPQIQDMLEKKDIFMELNGTWLTLYKLRERKFLGLFPAGKEKYNVKKYGMGNSMTEIGTKVVNKIRTDFELTQKDGFDNNSFYDTETFIDEEMVTYKKIIYKLSQT